MGTSERLTDKPRHVRTTRALSIPVLLYATESWLLFLTCRTSLINLYQPHNCGHPIACGVVRSSVPAIHNCGHPVACGVVRSSVLAIHNLHSLFTPSRQFQASSVDLPFVFRVETSFGTWVFSAAAPTFWDSLPVSFRLEEHFAVI